VDVRLIEHYLSVDCNPRFQSSYYNRESQSFLTQNEFKLKTTIIVVGLLYQNDSVKTGPIDVRIAIELNGVFMVSS